MQRKASFQAATHHSRSLWWVRWRIQAQLNQSRPRKFRWQHSLASILMSMHGRRSKTIRINLKVASTKRLTTCSSRYALKTCLREKLVIKTVLFRTICLSDTHHHNRTTMTWLASTSKSSDAFFSTLISVTLRLVVVITAMTTKLWELFVDARKRATALKGAKSLICSTIKASVAWSQR